MTAASSPTLDSAWVDASVREIHPDYAAALFVAHHLTPGPTTDASDALLALAETRAQSMLGGREPHELPEVQAWREAFAGFGVKPREGRSSVEALLRRAAAGLPRIDRLTDAYNAVSVMRLVPIGGEDLTGYRGPARLVVAAGDESFDTIADGQTTMQTPIPGEIVWRDDIGVTCRRWNWRQCVRTRLTGTTTDALFIIDGLGSHSRARAESAAVELMGILAAGSPAATFTTRTLAD
jgi:DNA/RNA-binding domain of Phe-tRNA-synthetase-like protein